MKNCPHCNSSYDDEMSFCLNDGTKLNQIQDFAQIIPLSISANAEEQTLNLPYSEEGTAGEKTLLLPKESNSEESLETEAWQNVTPPRETLPPKNFQATTQNEMFSTGASSASSGNRGKSILFGLVLGSFALVTAAFGIWWFLQKPDQDLRVSTSNVRENDVRKDEDSNTNVSVTLGETNTKISSNVNNPVVTSGSSNAKSEPSAEKEKKPTLIQTASPPLTPKPTQAATPPIVASSTPKPTPEPTPKIATPAPEMTTKTVSGGVLNGKASNLVKPPYPIAAKAVRASGAVNVQVTIDENGKVVSANAVSGHPMLRAVSESAARASKFSPTMLSGQRVRVTGVIVYNFMP